MKFKQMTWFVIFTFCCAIVGPLLMPTTASAAGTSDIVAELNNLYQYIDENDKTYLQQTRAGIGNLTENDWNTILGPTVITSQVSTAFGSEETAKAALKAFLTDFSAIYYSTDPTTLGTTIDTFRETHRATFQTLFGTDVTVDSLFTLLSNARSQIPNSIQAGDIDDLAFGTNDALVTKMPVIMKRALAAAITEPFIGKLSAIGWSTDMLIDTKTVIAGLIGQGNNAELALAKAAVRSETKLPIGAPTTFAVNDIIPNTILIMGKDATQYVEWQSSNPSVVEVTTDAQTSNYILTAKGPGTATLTAFRDVDPDNPAEASDWIFKYDVTVDGSAVVTPPSSGGGGSSTPASTVTTVTATQGGTITGSGATIVIPANATSSDIKVKVETVTSTANLPLAATEKLVSKVLEITKDKSGDFAKPVTITINFDKSKVDADKYDIAIYWLDTKTNKWVKLDNVSVDMTNGKVSGETTHFTKFAVIATPKAGVKPPVTPETPTVTLTDIAGHWAQADIQKLVAAGVISGYPNKTFKPDANISRAEFAVTLVKALKLAPKSGKVFNDTANHWAKDSIATAQAYGIINGYSDTQFGPDDKITREQMAVMVAKAANLTAGANAKTFTDAAKVSAWAKDAVIATSSNGIINGYPDGSFKPQANATRAEAVTVIAKVLK